MNSVLGILVALIMAFSSIGGTPVQTEGPVSFDAKISLDAQSLLNLAGAGASVPEETEKTITVVSDILDALTVKGVADKDAGEINLYAGNDLLLSLGARNTEEGMRIASSLLGSQVILISAEMMQASRQQIMASAQGMNLQALVEALKNLDEEQLKKDYIEICGNIVKAVEEKKGETENGSFTVDGLTFTAKTPVNITYTELMTVTLNGLKELVTKDYMKPVIEALNSDQDLASSIDESIKRLNDQPEEEKPELQVTAYSDEKGNTYNVYDMTQVQKTEATETDTAETVNLHLGNGKVDGQDKGCLTFTTKKGGADMTWTRAEDGSVNVAAKVDDGKDTAYITYVKDNAGKAEMNCKIKSAGTDAMIVTKTEPAENERTQYSMEVFFGNTEKALLTITGTAGKGGETVSVFEGDGIGAIPVEKFSDGEDQTFTTQMTMTLATNALKAMNTLVKNLPDESAAWVNNQLTQLMNPKTKTP